MIWNKALFRRWAKFLRTDLQSETGWPVGFVILMQHPRGDGGYKDKFTSHNMFSGAWTFSPLLWPLQFILQWPSITAVLWTSHTALNRFILLSCFQVVHVLSCLHNQIESSWRSRAMFYTAFVTITVSNSMLSSQETHQS